MPSAPAGSIGKPAKGDIVLSLSKPSEKLGDEGYIMSIGR